MLTVSIYRYNPEADDEPYMQDFEVDTQGKDVMVLDVLEKTQGRGSDVGLSSVLPRGRVRVGWYEHVGEKWSRLHHADITGGEKTIN